MSNVSASQVRRVRKYSAHARTLCSLLLVLLAASCALVFASIAGSPGLGGVRFSVGNFVIASDHVDGAALKGWLLIIMTLGLCASAAIIYLLRGVFANMARGEIFSAGNVRYIRRIGFIILCIGALQLAVPAINAMLMANGVIDRGKVTIEPGGISLPGSLVPFAVAGLIFLVSWIMQVGLGVSEEAAELRRDAELVV
jgi:hypothetical protein